jgi:RecA-family ATPase
MVSADIDTARACVQHIHPAALDYDEWLAVGMALKSAGAGMDEFDNWSARDPKRYNCREIAAKWASFKGGNGHAVGVGTLVKLCRDQGGNVETGHHDEGHELPWDATIGPAPKRELQVVRQEWLQDCPLPPTPNGNWNGARDFSEYLRALFNSDERVGIVTECWEQAAQDGTVKHAPRKGVWDRTAGELLERLACAKDLGEVVGDWHPQAGAWIRFNPLDGEGCSDENVTAFRYALVESDDISVERQFAIYRQLELPIAALVHSGGKSLHAIVKVDAPDFKEYQHRVDFLYDVCKRNGLVIDRKNRNPSRLSRLPGATRNGEKQWLVTTNIGQPTWSEWADWIAAVNDDLPDVECLGDFIDDLPPLAQPIIDGLLRHGHKMLLAGPSKAGKSYLLLKLAVAVAEGREWLGWKCSRGRVLYVNLELDRASCYHRLAGVYKSTGIAPEHAADIDVWNLRGKAMAMDMLAPKLIRRAAKREYSMIIIDPIYKVITGDENAADQMAKFCNQFDRVCFELGVAVVYCHHHSKGEQGGKRAHDRASGSGVFARDPDALLDMIELEIDEHRRKIIGDRWECDAMAAAFDRVRPNWREECGQDDATVADRFARWAETAGLGNEMRDARAEAHIAAETASAWRIEGILREFPTFKPRRCFFRHPVHVADDHGLIEDATAAGEIDHKRRAKAIEKVQSTNDADLSLAYATLAQSGDSVTIAALAEELGCTERTARNRVTAANKRGSSLRYKNGRVFNSEND